MRRLLVAVVCLVACGSKDTSIDPKAGLAELRTKLAAVAELVDKQDIAVEPSKPTPPMVFDGRDLDRGPSNTDFVTYEELRGKEPVFEPVYGDATSRCLTRARLHGDTGVDGKDLKRALGMRYLIVTKSQMKEPQALDASTFLAGEAEITGYVVDLQPMKVIGTLSVYVDTPEQTEYMLEKRGSGAGGQLLENLDGTRKLDETLARALRTRAQLAIQKVLIAKMGATFNR